MIKKILVWSRREIEAYLAGKWGFFKCPWDLISIYGTMRVVAEEDESSIVNCNKVLSLKFSDITKQEYDSIKAYRSEQEKRIKEQLDLFTEDHARQIIDFIDEVNSRPEDSLLMVHCNAGISRSGATGVFACRYLGLDEEEFRSANKNILPNAFILSTLTKMSNLHDDYEKWWEGHIPLDLRVGK